MKDFMQWLSERGIRTAINGNYPPAYGAIHGVTPNAMTAVTATAPIALKNTGKAKGKCDELSPEMRKEAGCKKESKQSSSPWKSFKLTQESLTEGQMDPRKLWASFLTTPEGQKYHDIPLENIVRALSDHSNWKLAATINSDIHAALGSRLGQPLIDALKSSAPGGNVEEDPMVQGTTRPSGDVYKQTQASRDMMALPHWKR